MTNILPRRHLPLRLWELLKEPRVVTALMLVAYADLLFIGTTAAMDPPTSLRAELGWVTLVWAACLIVGGVGITPGLRQEER